MILTWRAHGFSSCSFNLMDEKGTRVAKLSNDGFSWVWRVYGGKSGRSSYFLRAQSDCKGAAMEHLGEVKS